MLTQGYDDLFDFSINHPELFWDKIAKEVTWSTFYTCVLEDKFSLLPKWFVGGELNMSYNCLDKHIEDGYGDDVAVIYDSPLTRSTLLITYKDLLQGVEKLAGVLVYRCGLKKGDIVLLYFPVIPECLMSMLACTRIGVTYVVVYGGFSTKELALRIGYTKPKLIITCNAGPEPGRIIYYKEKIDSATLLSGFSTNYCLVYNRPNFKPAPMKKDVDLDWKAELNEAKPHGPVSVPSTHPLFIIYTSGTTGDPKVLVHSTGGVAVHNKYMSKYIIAMKPRETLFAISDFGWILGQSLLSYGALMMRTRSIIYEGKIVGTPDNAQFGRVLNWHKVGIIICPPTVLRILKKNCSKSDLELRYNGLYSINIGGEVSDPLIREWAFEIFGCKVKTAWGQTELSGPINLSTNAFNDTANVIWDGSSIIKTPGVNIKIVDRESGNELPRGTVGRIVIKLPATPGLASTFYNNDEGFIKSYFEKYPGYFDTMDSGLLTEDGSLRVEGRDDDIINVGAARICGSAVEEACLRNRMLAEAVVIHLADDVLGHVPFAYLVHSGEVHQSDREIIDVTIGIVKDIIGDVTCFQKAVIVPDLPRTISGKTHRHSLMAMVNGQVFKVPATVVNEHVYSIIYEILVTAGYEATLPLEMQPKLY